MIIFPPKYFKAVKHWHRKYIKIIQPFPWVPFPKANQFFILYGVKWTTSSYYFAWHLSLKTEAVFFYFPTYSFVKEFLHSYSISKDCYPGKRFKTTRISKTFFSSLCKVMVHQRVQHSKQNSLIASRGIKFYKDSSLTLWLNRILMDCSYLAKRGTWNIFILLSFRRMSC